MLKKINLLFKNHQQQVYYYKQVLIFLKGACYG